MEEKHYYELKGEQLKEAKAAGRRGGFDVEMGEKKSGFWGKLNAWADKHPVPVTAIMDFTVYLALCLFIMYVLMILKVPTCTYIATYTALLLAAINSVHRRMVGQFDTDTEGDTKGDTEEISEK